MVLVHMQGTENDNAQFGEKRVYSFEKHSFQLPIMLYTALSWDILHYSFIRHLKAKSQVVNYDQNS